MNLIVFLQNIDVPEASASTISRLLSNVPDSTASDWLAKVRVKDKRIAGTYYAEIQKHLSNEEFIALYQSLGYDFAIRDKWQDWWCNGSVGCTRQTGYTCNTDECP